ncbi:MAG: sigma-70 family RNA polymerase sigma factor [Methanocorpusculum sp.]|nr:sigma-70 family RNA polymerase sigma factor [Methanocorpusculum sp.]
MMQTGDLQAFDRLYDLLAGRALRTAAGILLSAQDAADAAQEAFIRVWSNIDSYHPTRPFAPWFYRILINECRRVLKKRRVFSTLEMIAERPAPTEEVAEIEINEALDRLPERQRMAISLKYLSGLSEKDVAKLMHTTQPAVKSLLTRARDTLRKEFEP